MKILLIGKSFPYKGGIAAFNERLAMELTSEGNDVTIYTYSLFYSFLSKYTSNRFNNNDIPIKGLHIEEKIDNYNPFEAERISIEIKRAKFDLIIYCYSDVASVGCFTLIAKNNKQSTVQLALLHQIKPEKGSCTFQKMFIPSMLSQMDGFVAMSQKVIENVKSIDKKNKPTLFSPHPIYDLFGKGTDKKLAMLQLGLNANYQYVLFFGAIKESKGLDLLIEAFADNRLRGLPVKLLVVGDLKNNQDYYFDIMYEYRLKNNIIFVDEYVPNNVVSLYFSASSIVAQPYKEVNQSGILQVAYHFDKPILITNVADEGNSIPNKKVGYVINPNVTEIADALFDFFDQKRETEMVDNVKIEKKKYAWSNMTNIISELYNDVKKQK